MARLPVLLLLLLSAAATASGQSVSGTVVALPCDASDTTQTSWTTDNGNIGVISIPNRGCLNNNGAGAPLDVRGCVGGDEQEIGYNLSTSTAAPTTPLPVEWASSGLCIAPLPSRLSVSVPVPLSLLPCSAASSPLLSYAPANKSILLYSPQGSATPLCLALQVPPPPVLSTVFGSHMVFQHDEPFALWGYASPGSTVTATLLPGGQSHTATPDPASGVWVANFSAVPKGGPYVVNVTSTLPSGAAGPSASLVDVFFGLLIVASGQSNLSGGNTPLSYVFNASQEIAETAYFPSVRIFSVGTSGNGSYTPLPFLAFPPHISWSVASPSSTPSFSAVAWLTAKRIAQTLGNDTAIGVIETAWGGTSIQVWLPAAVYAACGGAAPSYPGGWPTVPSSLFNGMVSPFLVGPFRAGGFVWYQGESNALNGEADFYDCALPGLITSWRSAFASPSAWFGVAQLAPWASSPAADNEMTAELRASELKVALSLPNVTVSTAADGGDPDAPEGSIHPRGKQHLGNRLGSGALLALYGVGDAADSMGPRAVSCAAAGSRSAAGLSATVTFDGVDASTNPLVLITPQPVGPFANSSVCPAGVDASLCAGFQLQDSTGAWYPADQATLSADATQLLLSASTAPSGAVLNATSSGWSLWPIMLLYNSRGVPAYPWRIGV